MSALRFLIGLAILSPLWASPSLAQVNGSGPVPAAENTPLNIAIGYSYVKSNLSGKPSVNLSGVETSATLNINPSWAATLDSSYVRAGRDLESGHSSYILSALAGPVFVAAQKHNTRVLVRALFGMSLVDGSVQVANQLYFRGWESRFSWAVGTGIERNLSPSFATRFNVDYLRTKFMGPSAVVQAQNGIRVSANLVFRISVRPKTRDITAREP